MFRQPFIGIHRLPELFPPFLHLFPGIIHIKLYQPVAQLPGNPHSQNLFRKPGPVSRVKIMHISPGIIHVPGHKPYPVLPVFPDSWIENVSFYIIHADDRLQIQPDIQRIIHIDQISYLSFKIRIIAFQISPVGLQYLKILFRLLRPAAFQLKDTRVLLLVQIFHRLRLAFPGQVQLLVIHRLHQSVDSPVLSVLKHLYIFHMIPVEAFPVNLQGSGFIPDIQGQLVPHLCILTVHGIQKPLIITSHSQERDIILTESSASGLILLVQCDFIGFLRIQPAASSPDMPAHNTFRHPVLLGIRLVKAESAVNLIIANLSDRICIQRHYRKS